MMTRRPARLGALVCLGVAGFTAGRPPEVRAAFPGANGRIAFWREVSAGSQTEIWAIDADGTGETNLTNTPAVSERFPDFSADGRRIAYLELASGQSSIRVMNADGSGKRTIVTEPHLTSGSTTEAALGIPAWSPDGGRIAVGAFVLGDVSDGGFRTRGVVRIFDSANGQLVDTLTLPSAYDTTGYFNPSWRPSAVPSQYDIAVLKFQTEGVIPNRVIYRDIVRLTPNGEVQVTNTPTDQVEGGSPRWSPDGQKVLYRRAGAPGIVQVDLAGNHADLLTTNLGGGLTQDVSPDGTTLVYDTSANGGATTSSIVTKATSSTTRVPLTKGSGPSWGPGTGTGLEVTLEAFLPTGETAEGQLRVQQDYTVRLTLANYTNSKLDTFSFAGGKPIVIDVKSIGSVAITSSPTIDPNLSLDPGQSAEYFFAVTTTKEGITAAHSKVTARDEHGADVEEHHSLLFLIENAQTVTAALQRYVLLKAMDRYLFAQFRDFQAQMLKRAQRLQAALTKRMTAQERLDWFGSTGQIEVSNLDVARGFLSGLPPELFAASRPKVRSQGPTAEEMNAAYDDAFWDEVGKGSAKWVQGYAKLGDDVKREVEGAWAAAVMDMHWLTGSATAEERAQMEAFWVPFVEGSTADAKSLAHQWKNDMVNWQATGKYMWQALEETERDYTSTKAQIAGLKKGFHFMAGIVKKETKLRASLLELADTDPLAFEREWARQDGRILSGGLPLLFDTLLGAGVAKTVSIGGQVLKLKPKGVAVFELAKETGVVDDLGRQVAANTKILRSDPGLPSGLPQHTAAPLTKADQFLKDTKGATLVQSSDHGNVYRVPDFNGSGVPETTLDAKAGILKDLENEYKAAYGTDLKLVEVLKTSSALRKPGGVAKLELTAAKTGKPSMIDAGMPPDALGEAVYWTSPTPPTQRPGFDKLPRARQEAAVKEWEVANERYAKYTNPPPNSKEAHLKELIGRRGRVPLDDAPNAAGIQRFIVGEFEEVVVTKGDATAKMIRVKHYEIEVVDTTRNDLVVNRKTVIDNLATAAPQTADADAVAVGKLKGYDSAGAPIVEPLSRAEREFVMGRYIDKNVKARRAGLVPDLAEHGVTLVMEDASAKVAGFLTGHYGAPFLPEGVGGAYLARIAPFVKASDQTPAQALAEMLTAVQKEGGFGQHAVVVTSDSRYLGAVPFSNW